MKKEYIQPLLEVTLTDLPDMMCESTNIIPEDDPFDPYEDDDDTWVSGMDNGVWGETIFTD